jgi:hypothetical protein
MRRFSSAWLFASVALAALTPLACGDGGGADAAGNTNGAGATASSSDGGSGGDGTGAGAQGGAGGAATTGSGGTGGDGGMASTTGSGAGGGSTTTSQTGTTTQNTLFQIQPLTATLDVIDGAASWVDFNAFSGGTPVNPAWIVDVSAIAGVNADGLVTATGNQGGTVTLKATYSGKEATATVTVNLHKTLGDGSVQDPEKALLEAATTPDATTQWTYPYDQTVFPKGLLAPELMWNGGGADDAYLVHFSGQFIDFKVFSKFAPPSRFELDDASWKQLTESGKGGPVKLRVTRLTPGASEATVVVDHTWTIANGSLRGTVYYWSNNVGRVLRIKPGATAPEDFLTGEAANGCSTCHSVSADGSTLIIGGDVTTSTWDLLTNSSVFSTTQVGKPVRNWGMPAISPNGKVLVENNDSRIPGPPGSADGDGMWDPTTGQKLLGTGLDGIKLRMPGFGPSGTKLAYVDYNSFGLSVYDFDVATTTVSNPVSLVAGDNSQGVGSIIFPSVAPDAKWIVYHRGVIDTRNGLGDLYLASIDQPGLEYPLDAINGATYPFAAGDRDRHYNYEPTFAPVNSGGYAWVVFTSRRTYGNRLVGTKDAVKQLWVAAIEQDPVPGQEPSHPAFRVPGQDSNMNMRGFWALDPCKQVGAGCGTGSECCNQNCVDNVCKEPDPSECAQDGNHCDVPADCCEASSLCINNICSAQHD